MVNWVIVYAKQALKDAKKLAASGLKQKAQAILIILANDPFQSPPPYVKLVGNLVGSYTFNTDSFMKYSPRKKSSVCYARGRILNNYCMVYSR